MSAAALAATGPFVLRVLPALAQAAGPAARKPRTELVRGKDVKMKYRRLGRTGLHVSEIGFGGHHKNKDRDARIASVEKALDLGINFFDAFEAPPNYLEISQLGDALGFLGRRNEAIIAAHLWTFGHFYSMDEIDKVLGLLKTDVIDIGWLSAHHLKLADEHVEMAIQAKEAGKIRFIGVTGHEKAHQIEVLKRGDCFDVMLFPYSYQFEKGRECHFPMARKRDMGIVTTKPFGGGSFLRAGQKGAQLLAQKEYRGLNPGAVCLKYIVSNPDICCAIPGMTTAAQVVENASASAGGPLTREEDDLLKKMGALMRHDALAQHPFLREWAT
jgi:predicted aldo/keto reductase-like oxidoreductase